MAGDVVDSRFDAVEWSRLAKAEVAKKPRRCWSEEELQLEAARLEAIVSAIAAESGDKGRDADGSQPDTPS